MSSQQPFYFSGGGEAPERYFSGGGEAPDRSLYYINDDVVVEREPFHFYGSGKQERFRFSGKGSRIKNPTANTPVFASRYRGKDLSFTGRNADGSYKTAYLQKKYNHIKDETFQTFADDAYDPGNALRISLRVNSTSGQVEMFVGHHPEFLSTANKTELWLVNNADQLPLVPGKAAYNLLELKAAADKAGTEFHPGMTSYVSVLSHIAQENNVKAVYGHAGGASVVKMMEGNFERIGIDGSFSYATYDSEEERRQTEFINFLSKRGDSPLDGLFGTRNRGSHASFTGDSYLIKNKPNSKLIGKGLSKGVVAEIIKNFDPKEYVTDKDFWLGFIG